MRKNILGILLLIGLGLGVLAEALFIHITVVVMAIILTPIIFVWTLGEIVLKYLYKIEWKKIVGRFKEKVSNKH
jgi:Flp pilus assembly protein TadB